MRILLANYRYFISGGPERYMFNFTEAWAKRGHEVIPFSVRYSRNKPSPYSSYFAEPLGSMDEVYFQDQKRNPRTIFRTFQRLFYDPGVEHKVSNLIRDTKPQAAYILHYLRKLSPALLVGIKKAGLPIVVRLSDYAMLCPQAHCLLNEQPCELCISKGSLLPSIRNHCVQNSLIASGLNAFATWYHYSQHYFDLIDMFVTTTQFMREKMIAGGFPEQRLCYIPTFVNTEKFSPSVDFSKENYIAFAGRIEKIKGLHVLISALAILRSNRPDITIIAKIAGDGDGEYISDLKRQILEFGLGNAVQFVGKLEGTELTTFLSKAQLNIVPSIWYENLPNAILESYACGTGVIASRLGP